MNTLGMNSILQTIPALLRGDAFVTRDWVTDWNLRRVILCSATILFGTALYGASMGFWRDPLQAGYTAAKLPLVILLTTFTNALLNGFLAPLLGLNIGIRQSLLAILTSFTMAAVILGSISPIIAFQVWNTPPVTTRSLAVSSHACILLTHVGAIALAGFIANFRLLRLLRQLSGSKIVARKILFAWLAGNLFLGSQLSWILRPFIGSPGLPVEFLRADAFHGNFYEAVFRAVRHLLP